MKNIKYLIINKFKKISGRLLLLTTVLFLMIATKGMGQCPGAGVDLQAVSIDPTLATVGIGQTTTITAVMANNGPCVIAAGTANVKISFSAVDLNLGTPLNFTSNCGQWVYLRDVPEGAGATLTHNLFFRNESGAIPVNGPLCFFTFDVKGKKTALTSPVNLSSSVTGDLQKGNQLTNMELKVSGLVFPGALTDFNVTANSCDATLSWKTGSADKVDSFEVEYGTSDIQFTKVGTVSAKNSIPGLAYKYINNQSTGKGYYRLKMIDKSGGFIYSKTISVDTKCIIKKGFAP
ncbi:MAG: hypothetical protein SGI96_04065 [Bacteroidota bacterium]|nr:hypothetical protein [Bacteroidota bacterium]